MKKLSPIKSELHNPRIPQKRSEIFPFLEEAINNPESSPSPPSTSADSGTAFDNEKWLSTSEKKYMEFYALEQFKNLTKEEYKV